MKPSFAVCILLWILCQQPWTAAAAETPTEISGAAAMPRSVFDASPAYRDPFHPGSTRRLGSSRVDESDDKSSKTDLASLLVLNGLSGTTAQRLAIINGKTFASGEQGDVVTQRGKVNVRCLEIRSGSTVILVGADANKLELRLKD